MDGWTSFALPKPTPTLPFMSPTTTRVLKENRLPPLTTLATRLMLTTVSLRPRASASLWRWKRPRPRGGPPRCPPR